MSLAIPIARALLVVASAWAIVGCRGHAKGGAPSSSASSGLPDLGPLANRPEVVARADDLAILGSRASGEEASRLLRRAADLRQRLWRIEGREADALEALELYAGVADKGGTDGCGARLDRALLEGELRADPSAAYRAVYHARVLATAAPCRDRADRTLAVLAAFRPLPNVLTEIERQARAEAGDGGAEDASPSPASVRIDRSGPVIVPTLSGQNLGPARITGIERYGARDAARIVVLVTRPTLFDVGFIPAGNQNPRLYVDIDGASYKGPLEYTVGGLVKRVRVGKRGKSTRVVLDLTSIVYRKVFYLPEPFRLVIDVLDRATCRHGARRVRDRPSHGASSGARSGSRRARSRRDGSRGSSREGRDPRHRPPGGAHFGS